MPKQPFFADQIQQAPASVTDWEQPDWVMNPRLVYTAAALLTVVLSGVALGFFLA